MNTYNKGAIWRVWDLQIQTIIDDRYGSISLYSEELKASNPDLWDTYINMVGGEANALLFDSKEYFADFNIPKQERCTNYVRNTFAFLQCYKPHLEVIGITDHNYHDDLLIDEFFKYSKRGDCQVLCGVEINVGGIHMLIYFAAPPYGKSSFSEGIKAFLSKIDVDHHKTNGVLTVCSKSCQDVIKEIKLSEGIFIYPHCNSNNGLFQERTKTDRTHLSDIFNYLPAIILQANSKESIDKVAAYIKTNPVLFKSVPIYTTASDGRSLREFGNPDKDGNHLWIKGDPTFIGLKQIAHEPTSRVRIQLERPEEKQDYLVIDKVRFIGQATDVIFPVNPIEINDKLNGIIGGKSSGKSILLYYIAKTIDQKQVNQKISDSKIDVSYDFENNAGFDFEVTWRDGEIYTLRNNAQEKARQITYVPQMFINYLAEKGGQPELRKLIQEILEQKQEFKAIYDAQDKIIRDSKVALTAAIENFYQVIDQLAVNQNATKTKGDKKAREDNVKQKNEEIEELRKKSGFTVEEEAKYQELKNLQSIYTRRFTTLSSFKSIYEKDYLTHLRTLKTNIGPSLNNIHINSVAKFVSHPLLSAYVSRDILSDNQKINDLLDSLIIKSEEKVEKISGLLDLNDGSLIYYRELLSPYLSKISNQEKLDELNGVIDV